MLIAQFGGIIQPSFCKFNYLNFSDTMAGSGNPYTHLKKSLEVGGETKTFFDLPALGEKYNQLPFSIRVLLESAVRNCDNFQVLQQDVEKVLNWKETQAK